MPSCRAARILAWPAITPPPRQQAPGSSGPTPSCSPQAARSEPRSASGSFSHTGVGVRQARGAVREQIAKLQLAEPGQRQIEAAKLQFAELEAEEFAIPARVQRKLVVGEAVSLDLRLRSTRALPSSARP
jgi:hypothetical protein